MTASPLSYHVTWQQVNQTLCDELGAFWRAENALPATASVEERAKQVVCIARDGSGFIAGVCTVYKQQNEHIGHPFYYYRTLVRSNLRQHGIAGDLIVNAWDHLNSLAIDGRVDGCIGVCVIVENKQLITNKREAVWPLSGLIYIGKNEHERPIRIRYFDGARI